MLMKTLKTILLLALSCSAFQPALRAQCATDPALIHAFTFNGTTYELILENKNWTEAAACAVLKGGRLVEINSQEEQNAIFEQVNNAGIVASNTVAQDGGNASYIWIGGNDISSEGNWVWNGNNDAITQPFWIGDWNGEAVGGLYNNWGNEPDNWNQQDGLGLAITQWPLGSSSPLGVPGQWNDVDDANDLYYIVEYNNTASVSEPGTNELFSVYPNPTNGELTVVLPSPGAARIEIISLSGELLLVQTQAVIDLSALGSGTYLVRVSQNGTSSVQLVVRQ
jgi:hypothetical protein